MADATGHDEAAARLRRHWDGVVGGAPERDGVDPALAETVRRLHALDGTPGPSRATVDRIWGELMDDAAAPTGRMGATLAVAAAPNGRVPHPIPVPVPVPVPAAVAKAGRRRPSAVAELATAAIVLLSVALGALSFRLLDRGPGDGGVSGIGAPVATVGGAVDVPGPEECRVAPRSPESVLALLDDPAGREAADDVDDPIVPPAGPPADPEIVTALNATLREQAACANAGDLPRSMALNTDRFLREVAYAPGGLAALERAMATPAAALPAAERATVAGVRDARLLADGRVGAVVETATVGRPASGEALFLVFVEVGDRYLVDDARPLAGAATPTPDLAVRTPLRTPTPPPSPTPVGATGSVAITMVGPTGATIGISPGACVILTGPQELPPVCDDENLDAGDPVDTDPTAGVVRIDGLLPGDYAIQQRRPPRGYRWGASADVTVVAGEVRSARIVGEPASRLVVGIDGADLRAAPFAEAEVVAALPIGAVLEATAALAEDDHPAGWWSVRNPEGGAGGYVRRDIVSTEEASLVTPTVDADGASVLVPTGAAPTPTIASATLARSEPVTEGAAVPTVTIVPDAETRDLPTPSAETAAAGDAAESARLRAELATLRQEQAALAATANVVAAAGEATALESSAVTLSIVRPSTKGAATGSTDRRRSWRGACWGRTRAISRVFSSTAARRPR